MTVLTAVTLVAVYTLILISLIPDWMIAGIHLITTVDWTEYLAACHTVVLHGLT